MATTELTYDDFVVVAQDEWKLQSLKPGDEAKHFAHFGGYEWIVAFTNQHRIEVDCVELNQETIPETEIHLELFIYRKDKDESYYKLWTKNEKMLGTTFVNPVRTILTFEQYYWSGVYRHCAIASCKCEDYTKNVAVIARILKDRPLFHDFTVDRPVGEHLQNDVKLEVGEQVFHVNKQVLGTFSAYFHRMFNNSNFVEANKDLVKTGETDAALFHDFLLAIIPTGNKFDVLPNSKNLAGLMRLAQYYGVDSLFGKFDRSLKFIREMPIVERILLAKKYMGKEFNVEGMLHGVHNLKEYRSISVALFKADS